jgi:hypothetical protein
MSYIPYTPQTSSDSDWLSDTETLVEKTTIAMKVRHRLMWNNYTTDTYFTDYEASLIYNKYTEQN